MHFLASTVKAKLTGKLRTFIDLQLLHTSEGIRASVTTYVEKIMSDQNLSHIRPVPSSVPLSADISS